MSAALILILHRQRDLVDRFRDAGATSPSTARTLGELHVRPGLILSRMSSRGVFVHAGGDRWWLDAAAWNRFRDRQRRRLVLTAILIVAGGVLLVGAMLLR